jgi:hypothetical protein
MGVAHAKHNVDSVTRGVPSNLVGTWDEEQTEECAWMRMARWRNRAKRYSICAERSKQKENGVLLLPVLALVGTLCVNQKFGIATTPRVYLLIAATSLAAPALSAWFGKRRITAQREADVAVSRYGLWRGVYLGWQNAPGYRNIQQDYYRLARAEPAPYNGVGVTEHDVEGSEKELLALRVIE